MSNKIILDMYNRFNHIWPENYLRAEAIYCAKVENKFKDNPTEKNRLKVLKKRSKFYKHWIAYDKLRLLKQK